MYCANSLISPNTISVYLYHRFIGSVLGLPSMQVYCTLCYGISVFYFDSPFKLPILSYFHIWQKYLHAIVQPMECLFHDIRCLLLDILQYVRTSIPAGNLLAKLIENFKYFINIFYVYCWVGRKSKSSLPLNLPLFQPHSHFQGKR